MSCTPVSDQMLRLLRLLHADQADEAARRMPEFETALQWGWIMPTGELTGVGIHHLDNVKGGILG